MESTKPCCETLKDNIKLFRWMLFEGPPKMLLMPYLPVAEDIQIRINFCPFCGKEIRDITLKL